MSVGSFDGLQQVRPSWIDHLPDDWNVAKLRWLAQRYSGGTPDRNRPEFWSEGQVPWLASGAVNQGFITEPTAFITESALRSSSTRWVPEGALVMALAGQGKTKGMVAQTGIAATCNQSMAAIVTTQRVKPRFLFWWLTSNYQNIRNMAGGDLRDGLNLDLVGDILCPIPSTVDQRAIAAFLDRETAKIDALVAEQERLIALLAEKRRAVVSHAVTKGLDPDAPMKDSGIEWPSAIPRDWQVLPLTRVVREFVDYRGKTPNKVNAGVPLITAGQIKDGKINHALDPAFITDEEYTERMTRGFPEVGDLLLTTEAPLGEVAQVDDASVATGQRIIIIKPEQRYITKRYLYMHFRSLFGQTELWKRASGSTASGIRADRLRASLVLVPPLHQQDEIVEYIEGATAELGPVEEAIGVQLMLLKERRAALISAAVTGKIDVREADGAEEVAA